MIRCVAFDFDGTLVDSNEIKRSAFFAITSAWDPGGSVVTETFEALPRADRYALTREIARRLSARGALPPGREVDAFGAELAGLYTRYCEDSIARCPEMPGATKALEALRGRGLPLYVNSGTPQAPLRRIVQRREMDRWFRGVLGSPSGKVENLAAIRDAVGVRNAEVLLVGDGDEDHEAARDFGCPFVGVAPAGRGRFSETPARLIPDLSQLEGTLAAFGGEET